MEGHTPHPQRVNLAWFVGTGRTRFLQVRLMHLKALAVFAVVLVLWAMLSLYLLHSLVRDSAQLQLTLQNSLTTLFDYQSRYDNVYETAYNTAPPEAKAVAVVTPPPEAQPQVQPEPQPLNVRKVLPDPQLVSSDSKDWQLLVKRPLFTATGNEFVLQVRLQNARKGKLVRGRVQAQAKLTNNDGTELMLPTSGVTSGKYRIKNRKTQTFSFTLPPASAGRIEHVSIEMFDKSGKKALWQLPINVPYVSPPSRLALSKKPSAASKK